MNNSTKGSIQSAPTSSRNDLSSYNILATSCTPRRKRPNGALPNHISQARSIGQDQQTFQELHAQLSLTLHIPISSPLERMPLCKRGITHLYHCPVRGTNSLDDNIQLETLQPWSSPLASPPLHLGGAIHCQLSPWYQTAVVLSLSNSIVAAILSKVLSQCLSWEAVVVWGV